MQRVERRTIVVADHGAERGAEKQMVDTTLDSSRSSGRRSLGRRIARGSLHDEVVSVLRDMIIQDELKPGTRIPEARLCEMLGISRTPLREAIRVLASEGLVTPLPRRGAVVATPTAEETEGLLLAIGALEAVSAPLACANFTAEEIAGIRALHERLKQYSARGNRKKYYETNLAIHESIVAGARNSFLSELHSSLSLRILRVRFFIDMPEASWARALGEHEKILEYVEARQGDRLAQLLLKHFKGAWNDCEATLPKAAGDGTAGQ